MSPNPLFRERGIFVLQLSEEEAFAAWVRENTKGIAFGPSRVLVTRDLQEAREFSDRGGTVLFVAREVKEYGRFSRACGAGHSIFKLYERSTLAHWHSFLWAGDPLGQEPYSEVPKEQAGAYRIVIRSARQAGGTWFSWNLLETLTAHGVSVEWNGVAPDNPLPIWLHRADARVHLGDSETSRAKVQIIDASGSREEAIEGHGIVVTDGDPAKVVPDGSEFVLNRHPQGIPVYPETLQAMQTGKAVCQIVPALDAWVWAWYQRVRGLPVVSDFHKEQADASVDHLVDKSVDKSVEHPIVPTQTAGGDPESETGFDFSNAEKGFDFDA